MDRLRSRETTLRHVTDPPPARRTLNHLSFRFLSKLCRIRYLYVRVALVRVSSCPSVEVLWCVAPMEDSHGDPSQEDCIDSNPLSTGSTQATTRLSTGLGNSSQFIAGLLLARHRLRSRSVAALVRVDAGRPYGMVIIIQEEGLGSSLEVTLELLEAWGTRSVPRGVCEQSVSIAIILVMT